jgi:hypothetical protein
MRRHRLPAHSFCHHIGTLEGKGMSTTVKVTRDNLNDVMEFDHVIRVDENGTVTDAPGIWAPDEVYESVGKVDIDGRWKLLDGYSGQSGYAGPVMHASEYIGGRMADDILSTPGVYVAVVVMDLDNATDEETPEAGWAVARLIEIPSDFPVKVLTADEIAAICEFCRPGVHGAQGETCERHGKKIGAVVTCGECGRSWDDSISTEWTPAPAARCPFEYFH